MNTVDYFLGAAKELHDSLLESVKGLSKEYLHFLPLGRGNHIAFGEMVLKTCRRLASDHSTIYPPS